MAEKAAETEEAVAEVPAETVPEEMAESVSDEVAETEEVVKSVENFGDFSGRGVPTQKKLKTMQCLKWHKMASNAL